MWLKLPKWINHRLFWDTGKILPSSDFRFHDDKCLLYKINLFGIKNHYIHISLFWRNNGNIVYCVFKQSWSSPVNLEFFCSPKICYSKYDTRIQAQADNTGNEPRNLQRKKLLTVNNLILSSKFMSNLCLFLWTAVMSMVLGNWSAEQTLWIVNAWKFLCAGARE